MGVLISVETLILAMLVILVAGLLRSHAEVLRRLEGPGSSDPTSAHAPPSSIYSKDFPAKDLAGTTLTGMSVDVKITEIPNYTLLAFLSSGCDICESLWADSPPTLGFEGQLWIVTRDREDEELAKLLRNAKDLNVVMSTAAWEYYKVPAHPYFVLVHGESSRVVGEGAAMTWTQVLSMVHDGLTEERLSRGGQGVPSWHGHRVDEILEAAGIGPDHPSLYPSSSAEGVGTDA